MGLSKRIKAKLRGENKENKFCWLEEKNSKKSRYMSVKYYRGFQLNSQSYYEGDCVLINVDIHFGMMDQQCEVARIIKCYSSEDKNYKGFIKVQWFTPLDQIRKTHRKTLTDDYPSVDLDAEIAKDLWSYENEVDVETISGHCCVKEIPACSSLSSVKRPSDALGPMYICRFLYRKSSPYICPLTEKDIYRSKETNSPMAALNEITNNSSKNKVTSHRSRQKSDKKTSYEMQEHNENLLEGKRRVKRKLLDLDEDQENICTVKKRKTENKQPSDSDRLDLRSGWSPLKKDLMVSSSQNLSLLSPCKKKILFENSVIETKVVLSPLKKHVTSVYSPIKENKMLSPLKKNFTVFSPLKQTNTFNSSPLKKGVKESPKPSPKSPLMNKKLENIKSIGQCRGLRLGEISDLLSDEETSEMEDDEGENNVPMETSVKGIGNNETSPRKRGRKIKEQSEDRNCTLKLSKKNAEYIKTEDDENVRSQVKSLRSGIPQTPKKEEEEEHFVKSSSKRRERKRVRKIAETDDEEETSIKTSKRLAENESSTRKSKVEEPKSTQKKKKNDEESKPKTPKGKGKHLALSHIHERNTPIKENNTEFEQAKAQLHVSAVPSYLPCREDEFQQIFSFVEGKLLDSTGGCMYVSGVPGTGKTATVREVLKTLKECEKDGIVPQFQFLDVNAMKLTKPNQLWVQIWEGLTGQRVTPDHAYSLFEKSIKSSSGPKRKSIFLLLDELDLLWTKKQDVMYNLFDLASQGDSRLIVITIANTMDLPERMMISRVQSRLGLTRMTFQPYTFKQLQEIIASRLQGIKAFDADAIQLVARKVAAVSGDARRALDICRRATELAELKKMEILSSPIKSPKKMDVLVGMLHVTHAISEMFSSPKVMAIRQCSQMVKYLLQAILTEFSRTGIEEALMMRVLEHMQSICRLDGLTPPTSSDTLKLVNVLSAQKIIFTEHSRLDLMLRIRLNISTDDVSYALSL